MIKIIPPGSFDFGEEAARLIKLSSAGLRGNDLSDFVKRAGHELADAVKRMTFHPGEVPIHDIAMGAVESTGPNRNADGWTAETLRKDHHTFAKMARWYRNHLNKDPKKSYGIVKHSYFNPEMKRVELIIALNGTKEAAERNGGLVADEEIADLESGKELETSMSTKCGHDLCSSCGNRARNRSEYCDGSKCPHGGLKKNAGRIFDDGHHMYADTYENKFFDLSRVRRHADRISTVLGKVAAEQQVISGAELAELMNVSAPLHLLDQDVPQNLLSRIKLARDLAEKVAAAVDCPWRRAFDVLDAIGELNLPSAERRLALKALAQEKIALSLPEWLQVVTGESSEKCAAAAADVQPFLPSQFSKISSDDELPELLSNALFPEQAPSAALQKWAASHRQRSLEPVAAQRRVWLSSLRNQPLVKAARVVCEPSPIARELAREYCAYQVEVLHTIGANDAITSVLAAQNYAAV